MTPVGSFVRQEGTQGSLKDLSPLNTTDVAAMLDSPKGPAVGMGAHAMHRYMPYSRYKIYRTSRVLGVSLVRSAVWAV